MPVFVTGSNTVTTYIILGSGGHTTEMCKINYALILNNPKYAQYAPIRYVLAQTDTTSRKKILADTDVKHTIQDEATAFIEVPRIREVGQSWLSTIFTTFWALLVSCWLVWRDRPQLVLCNGPGTCVPFCYAAFMWRLLRRLPAHSKIVYVESYSRVRSLSLSGKFLLPLVDMFVVQWPVLADKYKYKSNLRYFGRLM